MPGVTEVRSGAGLGGRAGPVRGASGFTVSAPGARGPDAPTAATPAAAAILSGALTLQELGCEAPRDRAARRRGYDLLASLRALQRAMLANATDPDPLGRLAALVSEVPEAADPGLREAVAALVLRARVELARRGS